MRNSYIFYQRDKVFKFRNFDCCEHLGDFLYEQNSLSIVGIPKKELSEFFLNFDNLNLYLEFLSKMFNVGYKMSSSEDIQKIDTSDCPEPKDDMIYVTMVYGRLTNKYIVAAWTCLRYLWYPMYTPIATLATTLYKLNVFEELMDIFAIASSYQSETDRALLPVVSLSLPGILYFREQKEILKELNSNSSFNGIFYKYPIYFNSKIKIKGDFFNDSETELNIKDALLPLSNGVDIVDIPTYMLDNIRIFKEDYLLMKNSYLDILDILRKEKCIMSSNYPALLSRDCKSYTISVYDPIGNRSNLSIKL